MARIAPTPLLPGGRIPSRLPQGPLGSVNAAAGTRVRPLPVILQPGPALALEQTDNRQLNAIQQAQRQSTGQARGNPFANGVLLEGLVLTPGANTISHRLGIPIRGVIIGAVSTNVVVSFAKGPSPAQSCVLTSSSGANVTVDAWLYG
jgi:hypothetical protein